MKPLLPLLTLLSLFGPAHGAAVAVLAPPRTAPVVDGRLDDDAWRDVPPLTAFRQAAPVGGAAPTRATELRLLQDGTMLYIAVRAFDPEPARIVARTLRRDAEAIEADDHIAIVLDPQGTGRNGFVFRVNALGAQRDGLISDGSFTRPDWDTLWDAATQVDAQGWTLEVAIPLATLAAPADGRAWGFNVERHVGATGERMRLFGAVPEREIDTLGDAGPLTGVTPQPSGWGLRLQPALRWSTTRATDGTIARRIEPSLDALYPVTPTLNATLTLNSDFSDADLDDRIVNLSRFELFRPEKRVFFTQDAGRFSFAGLDTDEVVLVPFFSRRIGLGKSLDAGLKLSGTAGPVELGAFGVQVPGDATSATSRMAVVRAAAGLDDAQRVGFIATQGTPDGIGDNRLAGLDYQYLRTDLPGGRTLAAYAWTQRSDDSTLGGGGAHGGSLRFPNLGLTGQLSWYSIDATFRPALGYVRETGMRSIAGTFGWWHRSAGGLNVLPIALAGSRRRFDGSEQSRYTGLSFEVSNPRGDYLTPEVRSEHEELAAPFEPLPGVRIAPGSHRFQYVTLYAGLARSREWSGDATLRRGGYYDGNLSEQTVKLDWRPSAHWSFGTGWAHQRLRTPSAAFIARTASLRLEHAGSTRSAQSLVLQHDNVSRQTVIGFRSRWRIARGQELKIALDRARPGVNTAATDFRATVIMGWTFER